MKISTTPLSPEEEAARAAEARKATAEGEFVAICNDKKRVQIELDSLVSQIENAHKSILETQEEIAKSKVMLVDATRLFKEEQDQLNKAIKAKHAVEDELAKVEEDLYNRKDAIEKEVSALKAEKIKKLIDVEDTITVLKDQKEQLEKDIETIKVSTNALMSAYTEEQTKLDVFQSEKEDIQKEIAALKGEVDTLQKQVRDEEETLVAISDKKYTLDKQIPDKQAELETIQKNIEKKTVEYKEIESKAFSILAKESALNQKEAFIRSQYERAGIKWE